MSRLLSKDYCWCLKDSPLDGYLFLLGWSLARCREYKGCFSERACEGCFVSCCCFSWLKQSYLRGVYVETPVEFPMTVLKKYAALPNVRNALQSFKIDFAVILPNK